jgi:rRNA-processing protein FCF1
VVVVLEGKARAGVAAGSGDRVSVLHATGSGDELLVDVIASAADQQVTLVTADRELRRRAQDLGADVVGPGWLYKVLGQ